MSETIESNRDNGSYGSIGQDEAVSENVHITGRTSGSYGPIISDEVVETESGCYVVSSRTDGSYGILGEMDSITEVDSGAIVVSSKSEGRYGTGDAESSLENTASGATVISDRDNLSYGSKGEGIIDAPPSEHPNIAPIANAGTDQTISNDDDDPTVSVVLNGSSSFDIDGTIVSYVWTKLGVQIATGVSPTVNLANGSHTITLTVTDDGGMTDTDTVLITVSTPPNAPPVANAGIDQTVMNSNDDPTVSVTLDGSDSYDSDGTIVSYVWTELGIQIATGVSPTIDLANGVHSITLTVTDDESATDTDTVLITVSTPNIYYVATDGNDLWSGQLASPNVGNTDGPFRTPLKAAGVVVPGDIVYIRNGTYTRNTAITHRAALECTVNGTSGAPITFAAFPGEHPVISGNAQNTYTIRIGNPVGSVGCNYIVLDGLEVTMAMNNGVYGINSTGIVIKNCTIHRNNQQYETFGNISSTSAGIHLVECHEAIIEDNRVYNNGTGIIFWEINTSNENPTGARDCIIRRNFVYGNANSNAYGNSSGIAYRFGDHCTIEDCVVYDNPDACINGLGNVMCKYVRNVLINAWQSPGNMTGFKSAVRGGGGNLVAYNIICENGSEGYDASDAIGDILLSNTIYKNLRWGILSEGRDLLFFNNISYLNFVGNGGVRELTATNVNQYISTSDYNHIGTDTTHAVLAYQPHTLTGDPLFTDPDIDLPQDTARQLYHPEVLFDDLDEDGVVSIAEVQEQLAAKYTLQVSSPCRDAGIDLDTVEARCIAAIDQIKTTCQTRMDELAGSTNIVIKQKINMWGRVKSYLEEVDYGGFGDLSGMTDILSRSVAMDEIPRMGALKDDI